MKTWDKAMKAGGIDSYSNYGGSTDHKDMLIFLGRNRDSDALQESNFEVALEELGGESETVQVHRFNHWACGWIELILIDSKDKTAVDKAESMLKNLEGYPVLDDDDYYRRESENALDYWKSLPLSERVELCEKYGESVFAARDTSKIPNKDSRLYEYLTTD